MGGKTGQRNGATPQVAIVGAGVAGLCMGIQLKQAGIDSFAIYDKGERLGGTWRDNTYPGCGCDVPSFFYSFSFEPKTDWSRAFAGQEEILAYLDFCADKYGLGPHFRFNTEIADARFDDDSGLWNLRTASGEAIQANVLVMGCGQLNRPKYPEIAGLDLFKGTKFHSARWNHDHDLGGERVACIGNGASALQFIPRIAPKVERLYIFQRSANWVIPKPDREYSPREVRFYTKYPVATRVYRFLIWALLESRWPAFSKGRGLVSRSMTKSAKKEIETHIADPKLREVLTPDYPIGCKRILISDDYYQALARDNVEVITDRIDHVTENAVVTKDGTARPVDTIIYATGFETQGFLSPIKVYGVAGKPLDTAWKRGAEAYLGLTVAEFPNFFMLYGPNTNLGHNSIIFMIECQVRYAMQCVEALVKRNLKYLDVRQDAMEAFNREIQERLAQSVWATSCDSWYKDEHGRITNNWAYGSIAYWWRTRHPDFGKYRMEAR